MNNTRLRKHDLGRAQKSRHRQKADKLLLECGVNDFLAAGETRTNSNGDYAVITVPANPSRTRDGNGTKAQMLLWDQPAPVAAAPEPTAAATRPPVPAPPETRAPQAAVVSDATPSRSQWRWIGRGSARPDRFTLVGFLKGCGIGLATAATLFLIYVLIQ
jgi:hypothetical protein